MKATLASAHPATLRHNLHVNTQHHMVGLFEFLNSQLCICAVCGWSSLYELWSLCDLPYLVIQAPDKLPDIRSKAWLQIAGNYMRVKIVGAVAHASSKVGVQLCIFDTGVQAPVTQTGVEITPHTQSAWV